MWTHTGKKLRSKVGVLAIFFCYTLSTLMCFALLFLSRQKSVWIANPSRLLCELIAVRLLKANITVCQVTCSVLLSWTFWLYTDWILQTQPAWEWKIPWNHLPAVDILTITQLSGDSHKLYWITLEWLSNSM